MARAEEEFKMKPKTVDEYVKSLDPEKKDRAVRCAMLS
jgi:hypothetical protein